MKTFQQHHCLIANSMWTLRPALTHTVWSPSHATYHALSVILVAQLMMRDFLFWLFAFSYSVYVSSSYYSGWCQNVVEIRNDSHIQKQTNDIYVTLSIFFLLLYAWRVTPLIGVLLFPFHSVCYLRWTKSGIDKKNPFGYLLLICSIRKATAWRMTRGVMWLSVTGER